MKQWKGEHVNGLSSNYTSETGEKSNATGIRRFSFFHSADLSPSHQLINSFESVSGKDQSVAFVHRHIRILLFRLDPKKIRLLKEIVKLRKAWIDPYFAPAMVKMVMKTRYL